MQVNWTARDLPDLSGMVVVITGANGGLGLATTRELAAHGATVVMACRDPAKGNTAASAVKQTNPGAKLQVMTLDLANLASIQQFASAFAAKHDRLDVLINNAGVIGMPKRHTRDGFELQVGVDFLGPFALTGQLLDSLRKSPAARVVAVGSVGWMHRLARIRLDDLNWERGRYQKLLATGQAKLALQMFSIELERRLRLYRESIISVAAHPGVAATNISQAGLDVALAPMQRLVTGVGNAVFAQTPERGALPSLYAAAVPDVNGGAFFGPNGFLELRGSPVAVQAGSNARSEKIAARLWSLAEELTQVSYLSGEISRYMLPRRVAPNLA